MSILQSVVNEFPDLCREPVVDLGSGYGVYTDAIHNLCKAYTIGVDVDCTKLYEAFRRYGHSEAIDFVCTNIAQIPFRTNSLGSTIAIMFLHEVLELEVDHVLEEVYRALKPQGLFLVIDRVLYKPEKPSEELPILVEIALHRAEEYAIGRRVWGPREPEEIASRIVSHGFNLITKKIDVVGEWIDGETFLRTWGSKTLRYLSMIGDEGKKKVEEIIEKICSTAKIYGYGPSRALIALFFKR